MSITEPQLFLPGEEGATPLYEEEVELIGADDGAAGVFQDEAQLQPPMQPQQPGAEMHVPPPAPPAPHDEHHFSTSVPLAAVPTSDGGLTILTMDVDVVEGDFKHAVSKGHHFGLSDYILAFLAGVLHLVMFICFLMAGSAVGAAVCIVTSLVEVIAFFASFLRNAPGAFKILRFGKFCCRIFMIVELGLAISASITNWIHFEEGWARWLAVSCAYAHTVLLFGLQQGLLNIEHGRMIFCFRGAIVPKTGAGIIGAVEKVKKEA